MQSIEARISGLACWQGKPKLTPLTGGLSTTSFKVEDDKGRFVARFGADVPAHHVFRDRERAASSAAAAAGLSPNVRYAEDSILVIDYIEGHTFTETDMRAKVAPIATMLHRAHHDIAPHLRGPVNAFWVFHIIRDYAAALSAAGASNMQTHVDLANRLERHQMPMPVIFGHHDLLPGNIIDDGKRLWLIDWEYAGFGTAMFDLANIAANGSYSPADEALLLETYFGKPASDQQRESFDAMKVASALREATWAMVSGLHLKVPGADYEAHATEYLARTQQALAVFTERHGKP